MTNATHQQCLSSLGVRSAWSPANKAITFEIFWSGHVTASFCIVNLVLAQLLLFLNFCNCRDGSVRKNRYKEKCFNWSLLGSLPSLIAIGRRLARFHWPSLLWLPGKGNPARCSISNLCWTWWFARSQASGTFSSFSKSMLGRLCSAYLLCTSLFLPIFGPMISWLEVFQIGSKQSAVTYINTWNEETVLCDDLDKQLLGDLYGDCWVDGIFEPSNLVNASLRSRHPPSWKEDEGFCSYTWNTFARARSLLLPMKKFQLGGK